ncbi:MAG: hypothetical protein WC580_08300 [Agrococcus sp.]
MDTNFDFQSDAKGKDPDAHSPMLRRFHQRLWSKALPGGGELRLRTDDPARYLAARIGPDEIVLKSDSIIQTFSYWQRMKSILATIDRDELKAFDDLSYTIGGMLVWPAGPPSINQDRGTSRVIADRIDLTLECVRLHYAGEEHPLSRAFDRNAWFFSLFRDFRGYVDFFLLHDLVDRAFQRVRFFLPFVGFEAAGIPADVEEYKTFMRGSMAFVEARNARIAAWLEEHDGVPGM